MNEKEKEALKAEFKSVVDDALGDNIKKIAGKAVADRVKETVNTLRIERALFGKDKSGLDEDTRKALGEDIKNIFTGKGQKAALLSQSDTAGGYLVPEEVHAGIFRIAASVGLIARDAKKFTMSTESLDVPIYTGGDLLGEYAGEDEAIDETTVTFDDARLNTKEWGVIFRVSNKLLRNASVDLADWLLALAAEGMSARMDKEGFQGGTFTGSPFVGLLGSDDVTVHTMATGNDTFAEFDPDEASDVIGAMPTSALDSAAFYMHRTVWAKVRQAKDANGNYLFDRSGTNIAFFRRENGIQPVGEIWGYPVYTTDYLPANSATAVSTKFAVFANLQKSLYIGDRGPVELARSDSATIGSNNTFQKRQQAIRVTHEHAITVGLPSAAVVIKTAAS